MDQTDHIARGLSSLGIQGSEWNSLDSGEILGTENGVFTSRLPGEQDFPSAPPPPHPTREISNINWRENIPSEEQWKKWHERDIPPPLSSRDGRESVRTVDFSNHKVEVNAVESSRPAYRTTRDNGKVVLKIFPSPKKQSEKKLKGKGKDKMVLMGSQTIIS